MYLPKIYPNTIVPKNFLLLLVITLKSNIQLEDSLLYLGSLEPAQFDSVIQEIQQRQQAELERLQQEREDRANTLVNIDRESNFLGQIRIQIADS